MSSYLVVAHQTAKSPGLADRLKQLAEADHLAEFRLLVPATPVKHMLVWEEDETRAAAEKRAAAAAAFLRSAGINLVATGIGDGDPVQAIADELRERPHHQAIVVSTLAPGVSRWLKMDVPSRVARNFQRQVIHVAEPEATQEAS